MKRVLFWLVVVSALVAACGQRQAQSPTPPATSPAAPGSPAAGPVAIDAKRLYVENCAKCHGLTGLGDGPSVGSLRTQAGLNLTILQDRSDEELFRIISQGKGMEMPPWELVLTVEERKALVNYIRTLAKPKQ